MRLSKDYFYTLRENVKDEDSESGNLLVRAGMIKKVSSGIYMFMPLGLKAMEKIQRIVREEMNAAGCLEVKMPALLPEEVYIESGRRENFGAGMFSLKDRFGRPFVLGPTHEELFATAGRMKIHSYKDLPCLLYQFQTKYRDEPRPRFGLIRVREFEMKDAYSFDTDLDGLDRSYQAIFQAYKNCFDRIGLKYVIVRADTGVMGGLLSEEFQAVTDIGEDILVLTEKSGYASNLEVAACVLEGKPSDAAVLPRQEVLTPHCRTIEEVAGFLGQPATQFVKTLIYQADDKVIAVLLRGDHEVNETKVCKLLGVANLELATPEVVQAVTQAPVGFAGPIGLKIPMIMDNELTLLKNFIVGANKEDYHFTNVNLSDFTPTQTADIRQIKEGDLCADGSGERVFFSRGIEIGNTFKLGEKYSRAMNLYYQDTENELKPVIMGSYGIGTGRCLASLVEQNHSEKAIYWPKNIAPIEVAIVVINSKDETQMALGNQLYSELKAAGYDCLIDDRNERPGVKFNDMDLIGAYCRVTVGKGAAESKVEVKLCREDESIVIPVSELPAKLKEIFA